MREFGPAHKIFAQTRRVGKNLVGKAFVNLVLGWSAHIGFREWVLLCSETWG